MRSSQLGLSNCLLLKELLSLVDTLGKQIEICDIPLDFNDGQVDKHTSNLGSVLLTNKLSNKFENACTDSLFVCGVNFCDGSVDWHGLVIELVCHGVSRWSKLNLHLHMTRLRSNHTRCWHRHSAGHWHGHSSWHWHRLSLHGCSL